MGRDKHWPVPFSQRMEHGELKPGRSVGVKAHLKWSFGSPAFNVNLAGGPEWRSSGNKKDNVALIVSYRGPHEGFITNSYHNHKWGAEEKFKGPVLKKDEEVYCRIEPEEHHFKIFINGEHIGNFKYRIPLREVTHIGVDGDIELNRVSMEGKYYMVPFDYKLNNFGPGRQLYISAKPEHNAEVFSIALRHSEKEVPLEISVRFKDRVVVRNTKKHDKWEKEERTGDFPFYPNEDFDMIVDVYQDVMDIIVNGRKFCSYKNRESPSSIHMMHIAGDVELRSVYV